MQKIRDIILPILLIVTLGVFLQYKYLNEFPAHIHAWSQSDRYALALGFERNNLNFFKPETFVMNHQFPDDFKKPHTTSITSVDFPIHDYIPAVIMKISGNKSPFIFRLYILLFSFLGLFFLYKLAFLFNKNGPLSLLIVLFAATSPVYVYYQAGFIPTIPSISCVIIGLYLYFSNTQQEKTSTYIYSLGFLTIAALSRSTFLIPLVMLGFIDIVTSVFQKKEKKILLKKCAAIGASLMMLFAYFLYNGYLRDTYGSIFLNHLMPASSYHEAKELLQMIKDHWKWHYFPKLHYILFALVSITAVIFMIKSRFKSSKVQICFAGFIIVYLVGILLFVVMMLKQFVAHDYYFLDSLFIPIILTLILFSSYIQFPNKKMNLILSFIVLFAITIPLVMNSEKMQSSRRETGDWDRVAKTIENYKGSEKFLDSLQISKTAKMLVIDAYAPNIPLIEMGRKGYAIMTTSRENISNALTWDFNYIVIQNDFFISDIYNQYPEIVTQIKKIGDNGKISVCKLSSDNKNISDFLELNTQKPVFEKRITFDSIPDTEWSNVTFTTENGSKENKCGYTDPKNEFGITFKSNHLDCLKGTGRILLLTAQLLAKKSVKDCEIICSINEEGKSKYYYSYPLKDIPGNTNEWSSLSLLFYLPAVSSKNYEFALYFWNKGKEQVFYDDITIKIY